jgi:GT2 family glycosyltransferase
MLVVPACSDPSASIVMLTWNAVEWSRRAIDSIVRHTEPPYELIVVDNGSTDGTRRFLAEELAGATIVLNRSNLGFGVAANIGAMRAHSRVVVFVNSDVLVHRGWLEPLRVRVDGAGDIAVAGSRIVNLDGRLDHAGGLLDDEGCGWHYGAGDDPESIEYSFPRDVDYVTGACMAANLRTFHSVGGFDPFFETAYFEDTDLCLRLKRAGWRIVYEPRSVVSHAGGASGSDEFRLQLLARNHPRFRYRWRELLARRPQSPLKDSPERVFGSRDAFCEATILLVCDAAERCRGMRDEVSRCLPGARITVVGAAIEGVESVRQVSDRWLSARRFHFDVVIADDPRLAAGIAATQPQALRVTIDEFQSRMRPTLASIGLGLTSE